MSNEALHMNVNFPTLYMNFYSLAIVTKEN